jgi:hypothetical protein
MLLISAHLVIAALAPTAAYAAPAAGQWSYPHYAPPDASVRFEVKPKQAEVFVDGFFAGLVDEFSGTFQRLRLPPGGHEIAIYMAGYHTFRQKVYLTPDNTLKFKHDLERLEPGEEPEPRPEPIAPPPQPPPQAGGQETGQPPYPPSPQYPQPRGSGGRRTPPPPPPPSTPEVRPSAGSGLGALALQLQPPDADIMIDGNAWRGPARPADQDRVMIELPEGRHTIEIRRPGYRTYITDVDIKRGETTPLDVSLRQ